MLLCRKMDTKLSEIEVHFLNEFEETDEDLYLLEIDVRCHFCDSGTPKERIRNIAKQTVESLVSKKLIELNKVHYEEVGPGTYVVAKAERMPDTEIDPFLSDERNWSRNYAFQEKARCYFHPTKKGVEALDQAQLDYENKLRHNNALHSTEASSAE